jgi:sugar/nucleoside kinase (ribokinase family)
VKKYDIVFIGHVTIDDIDATEGFARGVTGGAPFFGALAAAGSMKTIAVITRMAEADTGRLEPLKRAGIGVYHIPVLESTHMLVVHPTANMDDRLMYQTTDAGFFAIEDIPAMETRLIHLGALTDHEFTLEFMKALKRKGFSISVDMQGFVRQVDDKTRIINFDDVPEKKEIMGLSDFVKLDVVEAKILTGTDDLSEAASICESWGSTETIITRSEGVLARSKGKDYLARYSNRSSAGRTGRGDTTFGAYLARRFDYPIGESLKFAAALASIKMESPGPFNGSLDDVLRRMGLPENG